MIDPLHQRESMLEAVLFSEEGPYSIIVGEFDAARSRREQVLLDNDHDLTNGTFSIYTNSAAGVDIYTSFLPKPAEDVLKMHTYPSQGGEEGRLSDATAAAGNFERPKHTFKYEDYVAGDPKTFRPCLEQISNILHLFYMLPFIQQRYHDKIGEGEGLWLT